MSTTVAGPAKNALPTPNGIDPKKWSKLCSLLSKETLADLASMNDEQLAKVIAQSELNIREQETALAADGEVDDAKQRLAELVGPYKDAIKEQRAKQRIASYLRDQT